ncbi:tobamovirus multiplication protein 1-like [Dorcoceras hygrometricum]|uniref:Tobamovirus multiplication protein 1-like n=1 Tax=Dorcoceras hygrometricum TaxID=472368 RepID=A0A2Z7D208_9LAMI|nr:tobamovirus multiplication protein 1-like [Dorcoceras hygrometricum]
MLELRDGSCYPKEVVGVDIGLACVDGVIAIVAFYQCLGSELCAGKWNGLKLFLEIELCLAKDDKDSFKEFQSWVDPPKGYLLYFGLTPIAACKDWVCWSQSCGFIIMALPKILFVAAFLLLLSFWVDLCHQTNDDEEDEGCSPREALLEKISKTDYSASCCSNFCTFRLIEVGSRQKVVILVTIVVTAFMVASSLLIWIGMGKNPIDSVVVAQAGLVLFLKMRKVRSERSSSEMWKVAGLAIVCVVCFTSSACVALATNIPLLYHWRGQQMDGVYTALLQVLYYFIGSTVPSAFVLFEMRELPPLLTTKEQEETSSLAFVSDDSVSTHPQRWITSTIVQNQVLITASLCLMERLNRHTAHTILCSKLLKSSPMQVSRASPI